MKLLIHSKTWAVEVWKWPSNLIPHYFVHAATAQLPWHMQIYGQIRSSKLKLKQNEFAQNFNDELKKHLWKQSQVSEGCGGPAPGIRGLWYRLSGPPQTTKTLSQSPCTSLKAGLLLKQCNMHEWDCQWPNDHFVYAPSQWETPLHGKDISHCLGAYTKWSLMAIEKRWKFQCIAAHT